MAARIRTDQNETTRLKIKSTQLVKRLMDHATSDEEVMTTSQIRAAEILLKKTMPDLKQTEHSGEAVSITQIITGVPRDSDKT